MPNEKTQNRMHSQIIEAFEDSGLSIKQLSERSGVAYAGVHGVVTGEQDPRLSTVVKLCKVLGIRMIRTKKRS